MKALSLKQSVADKAVTFCKKFLWKNGISIDCSRTLAPTDDMKTNELKDATVKNLKLSIRDLREVHFLTSSILFVSFSGRYSFLNISFFVCFLTFCLFPDAPFDSIDLDDLYISGLFVFGGWHEMNAHRELHEEYPDQDPPWCMADECKVFVFPCETEEVMHNLRIVGAAQNKCEEVRHKKALKTLGDSSARITTGRDQLDPATLGGPLCSLECWFYPANLN